jgi:hypothetical protein
MAMERSKARRLGLLAALLGAALAGAARADTDDTLDSYFPLQTPRSWHYKLVLTVEHEEHVADHERTVARQVRLKDRNAFVVEDRLNTNEVVSSETFALEGDKVLLLAESTEGSPERIQDPPRVFLDLARLETVGAVWSYTSSDGRDTFTTKVIQVGPFEDRERKHNYRGAVVQISATLKSADGKRTATQERTIWLRRGIGIFRERFVVDAPGGHQTITDSELETSPGTPAPRDGAGK